MVTDALRPSTTPPPAQPRPTRVTTTFGLLVAALVGAGLAVGLAARAWSLAGGSSSPSVDALVEIALCGVGALVAAWLTASALVALCCLAMRLVGSSWRLGERLVHRWAPAVVRRSLVLVVGATVGLGAATGASATVAPAPSPSPSTVAVAAEDLGWHVTTPADGAAGDSARPSPEPSASPAAESHLPAQPTPDLAPEVIAPADTAVAVPAPALMSPAATAPTTPDRGHVVVAAGDSLWAIAARHLGPDATDAQIAASWPQWYDANAAVIGPDPSRIVPGQELTAPLAHDGASS